MNDQTQTTVLVVEDDPHVAEVVERYLAREGYRVLRETDGAAGLKTALTGIPDVIVLDVMLPSMTGLEICRRLRATQAVPVLMLTALGTEVDRITGLELGADDYLAKPFSPRELVARVKALLRRARGEVVVNPAMTNPRTQGANAGGSVRSGSGAAPGPGAGTGAGADGADPQPAALETGGIRLDPLAHECHVRGTLVALTAKEFDLLEHLMRHPRRAFRREELLDAVWGYGYGDTSTVTVHVRRLREKVEQDPSNPGRICTVWGVGYRFEP
jgi:DNA-binding response OmpR family regulator